MTGPADRARNQQLWDLVNAQFSGADGLALWQREEIVWGLFATPEARLGALGEVAGLDVLEVGCGVAHVSAWLARRGARVLALDLSGAQVATARAAQAAIGPTFPLLQADAEALPLRDRCVDLVVSEHGAPAWCDPEAWVGEAARVLRPGGRLVFLTNSPLSGMCVPAEGGPAGERLLRGPAELRTITWPGGGTEHHPSHGDWIRVLVSQGFVVEGLRELLAPQGGDPTAATGYYGIADLAWARRWPVEDLWSARLRG